DTQPPTAPGTLTAAAVSSSQINLSWTASTDNVGVTNYLIERCQGAGCSSFAQIATATTTTFNNTGLVASTSYSYRVRATDAASNLSAFSSNASATTQAASGTIAFRQINYATPQTSQSTVTVPFPGAQTRGDLNVVVVGWSDSTTQVQSVTDTKGNVYVRAVGPVLGIESLSIYSAKNIVSATANGNAVTVTFTAAARFPDIRVAEYSGIDPINTVDVTAATQGNSSTSSSGSMATTNANDLLVAANNVQTTTASAGAGFTSRVITSPDGNILEDRVVTATG